MFGIVLLLVLGLLAGLTSAAWWYQGDPGPRRSDHMVSDWEGTLTTELNLDDTQQQLLEEIGEQTRQELRQLHREYRPRLDEIFTRAHGKLIPSLTSEQRDKLEQLVRERWSRNKDKGRGKDKPEQESDRDPKQD
jgi:Spy/CpxP family protein refolding chaperone